MLLSTLLQNLEVVKPSDFELASRIEVSGLVYDSRKVKPDMIFVAVPGTHVDGHAYIPMALQRGACAIIAQYAPAGVEMTGTTPVLLVPDSRAALADLAGAFYGYPSRSLRVIGVTGTDGKTTTTNLISAILDGTGHSNGLMSTVNFKIGGRVWDNDTRQSTLESLEIQEMLAEFKREGVEYAVLESTSHALVLDRVRGVDYDVAVVTNITSEHLDFHQTRDNYLRAKARLFEMLSASRNKGYGKYAILNADDSSYAFLRPYCRVPVVTYGIDRPADLRAHDLHMDGGGTRFRVSIFDREWGVQTQLFGRFNVYNCLAALAVGYCQQLPVEGMLSALAAVPSIPGRMESIICGQEFAVVVDYAHTADSLEKVLAMLRPLTTGRIIAVFGSAGERDRSKRGPMGMIATRFADLAVFTDEDPREEDRHAILADIAAGAQQAGGKEGQTYLKEADRRKAIALAFRLAQPGDTVLLAGKGHEQCIIVGREKIPWDDRKVARELLGC